MLLLSPMLLSHLYCTMHLPAASDLLLQALFLFVHAGPVLCCKVGTAPSDLKVLTSFSFNSIPEVLVMGWEQND